jgi:RNA polymerase sigma factor (sigma-70 family)
MTDSPTTRPSLLLRIRRKDDHAAWAEFVEIYAPLIHGYCRRRGLQEADAANLTQDILSKVMNHADRFEYDTARGRFRGWLLTLTRNRINDHFSGLKRQTRGSGDTGVRAILEQVPDQDEQDDEQWDTDYQHRLFHWVAEKIRDEFQDATWRAFWNTAVKGQAAKQVAENLSMSVGAVYIAKSRVLARLKIRVRAVDDTDDWLGD